LGDGEIEPSFVFGRRALQLRQERPIDLLDIDAPALHRIDAVSGLDELVRAAALGSAKLNEFHVATLS
jgi:hypothetical protein